MMKRKMLGLISVLFVALQSLFWAELAIGEVENSEQRVIIPHGSNETQAPKPASARRPAQSSSAATTGNANSKRGREYSGGRDEDDLRVQEKIAVSPRSLDARAVETVTSESEAAAEPAGQD